MKNELVQIIKIANGYVKYAVICRDTGLTLYTDVMNKVGFDFARAISTNGFDLREEVINVNTTRNKNITVTHIRALANHFNITLDEDKILKGTRLITVYTPKGTDIKMDSKQFREWVASEYQPFKFQTK